MDKKKEKGLTGRIKILLEGEIEGGVSAGYPKTIRLFTFYQYSAECHRKCGTSTWSPRHWWCTNSVVSEVV